MMETANSAPSRAGQCVFSTPIGFIAMAWSGRGFVSVQLPGADRERTRNRLMKGLGERAADFPSLPEEKLPLLATEAIERIRRYASGERVDFSDLPVDLADIDPFRCAIYLAARRLSYGETTTYGALASNAGYPGLARETGQALGANPLTIIVPCHRILAAGGKIGGFSAYGGISTKRKLLAMENARFGAPDPAQPSFSF
jgi:methylated-DNA-[protein]-cysteine S-methyltransferase